MVGIGEIHLDFTGRKTEGKRFPDDGSVNDLLLSPRPASVSTSPDCQTVVLRAFLVAFDCPESGECQNVTIGQHHGICRRIGLPVRFTCGIDYVVCFKDTRPPFPADAVSAVGTVAMGSYSPTLVKHNVTSITKLFHPRIMQFRVSEFASAQFYDGSVVSLQSVAVLLQMSVNPAFAVKFSYAVDMPFLS